MEFFFFWIGLWWPREQIRWEEEEHGFRIHECSRHRNETVRYLLHSPGSMITPHSNDNFPKTYFLASFCQILYLHNVIFGKVSGKICLSWASMGQVKITNILSNISNEHGLCIKIKCLYGYINIINTVCNLFHIYIVDKIRYIVHWNLFFKEVQIEPCTINHIQYFPLLKVAFNIVVIYM